MARAEIIILRDNGADATEAGRAERIEVNFNPNEYSLSKSVNYRAVDAREDAPGQEFSSVNPRTLSLSLRFDTYEIGKSVETEYLQRLRKTVSLRDPARAAAQKDPPPQILFSWGAFRFKGVVTSLSEQVTFFLENGTPVRASVSLSITESNPGTIDAPPMPRGQWLRGTVLGTERTVDDVMRRTNAINIRWADTVDTLHLRSGDAFQYLLR